MAKMVIYFMNSIQIEDLWCIRTFSLRISASRNRNSQSAGQLKSDGQIVTLPLPDRRKRNAKLLASNEFRPIARLQQCRQISL